MNLDYRKASLDLTDLNQEKSFNKAQAFRQSQLGNMLLVRELAERLEGSGVTCNAAYPGVVGGTGQFVSKWSMPGLPDFSWYNQNGGKYIK
jgi:NAD(P)-dependent dehydrogenase (short-subunit alcohol dehydrogenase family)